MSLLAINGGPRIHHGDWLGAKWPLPTGAELHELQEVLDSYVWKGGTDGPKVGKFSQSWADYCESQYCVPVTNGTTALGLAIQALKLGAGDEIIIPAWCCAAVADAVHGTGATPVFADISPHNLGLDPQAVLLALSAQTRAIIAVHFGGQPADLDALPDLADEHNLVLIEDAASSHGVMWRGHKVGALRDCGVFSFGQGKNLTCGQGGAIVTNSSDLAGKLYSLSEFGAGVGADGTKERHYRLGGNQRMSEFHAAVLLAQLAQLDERNIIRARNGERLSKMLCEVPGITPIPIDERVTRHTWNLLLFRYDSSFFAGASKNDFCRAMTAEGVFIAPMHSRPLFTEPMYDLRQMHVVGTDLPIRVTSCPAAERACAEVCAIHHSMLLTDESDLELVIAAMHKLQRYAKEIPGANAS